MSDTEHLPLTGPEGPFPRAPLSHVLERRWLHYAFFSRDGQRSMIANIAWLGADNDGPGLSTAVLLAHDREFGFGCSEWNAVASQEPWSAFRARGAADQAVPFRMASTAGTPAIELGLRRTSTPCASQCATFAGNQFMRWQSEPGVLAQGMFAAGPGQVAPFVGVGYHERVRGCWGWPEMGGWVFGFCNDLSGDPDSPPPWSIVFTLLQTTDDPNGQAASVMVWRRGKLLRHIPRRLLRVSVAGQLDRDCVGIAPGLAPLLGTAAAAPIPAVLCIDGYQGADRISMRFRAHEAARLVIPSESSFAPFSVHETLGSIETSLEIAGRSFEFQGPGVVEFAGGACEAFS